MPHGVGRLGRYAKADATDQIIAFVVQAWNNALGARPHDLLRDTPSWLPKGATGRVILHFTACKANRVVNFGVTSENTNRKLPLYHGL